MFIKKIFDEKIDESVHKQFVKFSKGNYDNRAVLNLHKTGKIKIKTTFELSNDLVMFVSNLSPLLKVKGFLLTKQEIPGLKGKRKKNLLSYELDKEMDSSELRELVEPCYFALLDVEGNGFSLKMKKKKLPRPKKGKEGKVNDKFCVLELDLRFWPQVMEEFFWDLPLEIKKARVVQEYIINDVVIPKELEREGDFERIRLEAKRKGKILRKAVVDGKESVREKEFEA